MRQQHFQRRDVHRAGRRTRRVEQFAFRRRCIIEVGRHVVGRCGLGFQRESAGARRQHLVAHHCQRLGQVQIVEIRPGVVAAIGKRRTHDGGIAHRARCSAGARHAGVLEFAQLDHTAGPNVGLDIVGTGSVLAPGGAHAHGVTGVSHDVMVGAVDHRLPLSIEVAQQRFAQARRNAVVVIGQEQQMGSREIATQLLRNRQQVAGIEGHHRRHVEAGGHAHRFAGGIPFADLNQRRGGPGAAQQAACAHHVRTGTETLAAIGINTLQRRHHAACQAVLARRDQQLAVRADACAFAADALVLEVGMLFGGNGLRPGVARAVGGQLETMLAALDRQALVFRLFALGFGALFLGNAFPVHFDCNRVVVIALPDTERTRDDPPPGAHVDLAQHVPGFFLRAEAVDFAVEQGMAGGEHGQPRAGHLVDDLIKCCHAQRSLGFSVRPAAPAGGPARGPCRRRARTAAR